MRLSAGIFPKRMQIAKVSVLYKKGDKNDINNYRPLSTLPVFLKGLEKLIYVGLSKFFDKYRLITRLQFGFQKHRSTNFSYSKKNNLSYAIYMIRKLFLEFILILLNSWASLASTTFLSRKSETKSEALITVRITVSHRGGYRARRAKY